MERAIAAHGGYGAVAGQIGWAMAYTPKRPRGYWNSITNVKSEVDDFINANGLQPGIVPSLRDVRGADRSALSAHDLLPVVPCEKGNKAALHRAVPVPDTLVHATLAYHREQLQINQSVNQHVQCLETTGTGRDQSKSFAVCG